MEIKLKGGPLDGIKVEMSDDVLTSKPFEFGGLLYKIVDGVGTFQSGRMSKGLSNALASGIKLITVEKAG